MIERSLQAGVSADYVLHDTWFTQQPLIQSNVEKGLDVIGMVKATNQRYLVKKQRLSLKVLYKVAMPVSDKKGILRSIYTKMANGIIFYYLLLQKNFQGMSYDLLVSHTTIVFSRYIVLSWQNRCNTD